VAGSFGGLAAHRLFIPPGEPWADPAAGLSAPTLELTRIPSSTSLMLLLLAFLGSRCRAVGGDPDKP
jgi:hypothetical protein